MPAWALAILYLGLALASALTGVLGSISASGIEAPQDNLAGKLWLAGGGIASVAFLVAMLFALKRAF